MPDTGGGGGGTAAVHWAEGDDVAVGGAGAERSTPKEGLSCGAGEGAIAIAVLMVDGVVGRKWRDCGREGLEICRCQMKRETSQELEKWGAGRLQIEIDGRSETRQE